MEFALWIFIIFFGFWCLCLSSTVWDLRQRIQSQNVELQTLFLRSPDGSSFTYKRTVHDRPPYIMEQCSCTCHLEYGAESCCCTACADRATDSEDVGGEDSKE